MPGSSIFITELMKHLPNLLIVDDDPEQLHYIKIILKGMNLVLFQASSGHEALEKINGVELALAIIDVRMPVMDGFELAKAIMKLRPGEKIPIIFLTGDYYIESNIYEGYSSGAVDYIFKPVDHEIFGSKIRVFLDLFNQKQKILSDAAQLKKNAEELNIAKAAAELASVKYSELYDFAPTGYFTLSPDKTIQDLNLSGALMLGEECSELVGRQFGFFIAKTSITVFNSFFVNVSTGKSKEKCEVMLELTGNQPKFMHIEGVLSENGKQVLLNIVDITERKHMEEELKRTSARLELATRAGGVGVWDYDIVNNNLTWDDHMFALYGLDKKNFSHAYKSWLEGVHPDDKEKGDNEIRMAMRGEKEFDTEFRVCWPDGAIRNVRALADVIRDESGNPLRLIGTNWDITEQKELEEKLKSSEANFRTFFETMSDMIIVGNLKGEIIYINNAVLEKLGYTRDELLCMHVPEMHPAEKRDEATQIFAEMFAGTRDSCPLPLARKDGSFVPVETRAWLGKWNGKDCIFGISKDLSAEQEALQKFNKIFYNNPTLIAISSVPGQVFTDVNNEFLIKTGYTREEVIGKTSEELGLFIKLEQQRTAAAELQKNTVLQDVELQVKTKSGRILNGLFSGELIESQGKNLFLTVMVDITERKIAELAVKVSEEKYKTMLNASPDGILLIDMNGIITEVSEIGLEIMCAATRDELLGKDFFRFIPSDEKDTIAEIIEKTMNEGLIQNIGLKIRKKNHTLFAAETSVTLIQDPHGLPLAYMIILRDISQRKKTEAKQMHADRMSTLGEMAAGMAHEINQPLNIISMVMDKMIFESERNETIDLEFLKKKSDKIFENLTRIRDIIDHVRAFSRTHDDYLQTSFNVNLSIINASSMVVEQFKHHGIRMDLQLAKEIPPIIGNTYKFEQVILNLLVNAKDAVMEKNGKQDEKYQMLVGIRSYHENQSIIVEITDNGIGISNEDIHNIMLPFYTTKEEGKGTGLGLSICYQIMKEMNGLIEITSDKLKGTKIRLLIDIQTQN